VRNNRDNLVTIDLTILNDTEYEDFVASLKTNTRLQRLIITKHESSDNKIATLISAIEANYSLEQLEYDYVEKSPCYSYGQCNKIWRYTLPEEWNGQKTFHKNTTYTQFNRLSAYLLRNNILKNLIPFYEDKVYSYKDFLARESVTLSLKLNQFLANLDDQDLAILAPALVSAKVDTLDFSKSPLTVNALGVLFSIVNQNTNLRSIDLRQTKIGEKEIISLQDNFLKEARGVQVIADNTQPAIIDRNKMLDSLYDIRCLKSERQKNNASPQLKLENLHIAHQSEIEALCKDSQAFAKVRKIIFDHCTFSAEFFKVFAERFLSATIFPELVDLSFTNCDLKDQEGKALLNFLDNRENSYLAKLDLSHNSFTDFTVTAINSFLSHSDKLVSLNIDHNSFTQGGLASIASELCKNRTLISFSCLNEKFTDQIAKDFVDMINNNQAIMQLSLLVRPINYYDNSPYIDITLQNGTKA
jgi:hypothetical protein